MIRSNHLRRMIERSLADFFAQGLKAREAASTAAVVSSAPKRGTFASSSPVAGLSTASTPSPIQAPST